MSLAGFGVGSSLAPGDGRDQRPQVAKASCNDGVASDPGREWRAGFRYVDLLEELSFRLMLGYAIIFQVCKPVCSWDSRTRLCGIIEGWYTDSWKMGQFEHADFAALV